MSDDERAALVGRLRIQVHGSSNEAADLLEADGKRLADIEESTTREVRLIQRRLTEAQREKAAAEQRLALAEKTIAAIGEAWRNLELPYQPVGNLLADYDAAKEARL